MEGDASVFVSFDAGEGADEEGADLRGLSSPSRG